MSHGTIFFCALVLHNIAETLTGQKYLLGVRLIQITNFLHNQHKPFCIGLAIGRVSSYRYTSFTPETGWCSSWFYLICVPDCVAIITCTPPASGAGCDLASASKIFDRFIKINDIKNFQIISYFQRFSRSNVKFTRSTVSFVYHK
jgi:hypothetical protein